jgi:hypothetical protein
MGVTRRLFSLRSDGSPKERFSGQRVKSGYFTNHGQWCAKSIATAIAKSELSIARVCQFAIISGRG